MSIVRIVDHDENIYHLKFSPQQLDEHSLEYLIAKEDRPGLFGLDQQECAAKPKLYGRQRPCLKRRRGSFGVPKVSKPDPKNFLKKGTGNTVKPILVWYDPEEKRRGDVRRPPIPRRIETLKEQDVKLESFPKDFVGVNIKKAVQMKPKRPERAVTVDNFGTRKSLREESEVKYILSENYGKLPSFVGNFKVKQHSKTINNLIQMTIQEKPACVYVTRDRRGRLLAGLKSNWEELQGEYQTLPILTDTIPKKQRKTKIETQLKQLEKDIVFIERHPFVYVYPDDEDDIS